MKIERTSGILLHLTSLPSPDGVGTMGRSAYEFVDFLKSSGVRLWQVLPVGPTGYGESPYQSGSTFAGNPLLIDLDLLREEGLLDFPQEEIYNLDHVEFDRVRANKEAMLERAFLLGREKLKSAVSAFRNDHAWVEDYALFAALKESFGGVSLTSWPDQALRLRKPSAIKRYRALLRDRIDHHAFVQFLFDRQWRALRDYANGQGVRLFGDMPIYVAEDSADVWTQPELFRLDEDRRPIKVAGVPPDYFSADGQRWGNPVYRWKAHERTRYAWWIERMRAAMERFDLVRIDHFIGFANFYAIPAACPTARVGEWKKGPGRALFRALRAAIPNLQIVAEDLGVVNKRVKRLLKWCGYPGMKVLQFSFSSDEYSLDLPDKIKKNTVVYTGTHDNTTTVAWWEQAIEEERALATQVLGLTPNSDIAEAMIRAAMATKARTCVIPMQDYLGLGAGARMNQPGTVGGNWSWRMREDQLTPALSGRILSLNRKYGRGTEK